MDKIEAPAIDHAIRDLAAGYWTSRQIRPTVQISNQPTLFPTSLRERFLIKRRDGVPFWPKDPRFTLDFVVDDSISTPFLRDQEINWCAPCHSLISFSGQLSVSITGILTFDPWISKDDYRDFFGLDDLDAEPLLIALASSLELDIDICQRALESTIDLVYGIEIADSTDLVAVLNTVDNRDYQ